MGTEQLTFKSEEEREAALAEIPDEPPKGTINIEEWQAEQEEKERAIKEASISEDATPEPAPKAEGEPPAPETPPEPSGEGGEDDYVDFSQLGKVKREELPENLRNYKSAAEILKQASHARRYANSAEDKLHAYEERIVELETTAKSVPELQKELENLRAASKEVKTSIDTQSAISTKKRSDLNNRLDIINAHIDKLSNLDDENADTLQKVISSTVDAFKDTLSELDSVKVEFSKYKSDAEKRYKNLEDGIKSVSESTKTSEARRKAEFEQKTAERGLADLQQKYPELRTSKPLYADNRNDVETAIVKMAEKAYGRRAKDFNEVNRFVSAYNTKEGELMRICEQEGISPADFGINDTDVRNYGILMNVYWKQRGEQINPHSGRRSDVVDWRGRQVTFPDFEAAFKNMKESGGLSELETEMKIIEAEKRGQESLNESLHKRDTSTPTLSPTGAPPEGQEMTKEQALEIIGENVGRMTVDEERMERLLRAGDKKGWEMFYAVQKACEKLEIPIPEEEAHWLKSA